MKYNAEQNREDQAGQSRTEQNREDQAEKARTGQNRSSREDPMVKEKESGEGSFVK